MATGDKLHLRYKDSGSIYKTYNIVIYGDINDGEYPYRSIARPKTFTKYQQIIRYFIQDISKDKNNFGLLMVQNIY